MNNGILSHLNEAWLKIGGCVGNLKKTKKLFISIPILLLLSGCDQLAFDDVKNSLDEKNPTVRVFSSEEVKDEIELFAEKLAEKKIQPLNSTHITDGLRALSQSDFVQANASFQQALKFDPLNSHLHMLNGLAHQMRGAFGDPDQYKMAEVGYELAARIDPGDSNVPYFRGILNFRQQKYRQAQDHFVTAVSLDPENPNYFVGLAAASYYLGELDRAYTHIEKAIALAPSHKPARQSAGIIYASMGDFDKARITAESLGDKNSIKRRYLQQRIVEWRKYYARNNLQTNQNKPDQLVQNLDIFGVPKKGMFDPTGSSNQDPMSETSGSNTDSAPSSTPPTLPAATNVPTRTATPVTNTTTGQKPTAQVPVAKPKTKIPGMALVDVAIIRSEEIFSTSKGVNLLNGLNIFFTGDQIYQSKTPGLGRVRTDLTTNDTITLKLGTAGAGLTYSLNIFSNSYDRNEVIARPTILVEDKKKSSFFSGGTMHIVIEGGVAGSGAMQPLNTGVKLEVTPDFLDKETINFNVFAQRIFLEADLSQVSSTITGTSFAKTSKTTISANLTLRYGETMVLSGLSDQEKEVIDDKVPGLGDAPGIQYLFRNQRKTSSKKTVLILLTPRRASLSYQDGSPRENDKKTENSNVGRMEKQSKWMQPAPHLKAFAKHLGKYEFFNHYRKGDMQLENWAGEGTINDAIRRTLEYLYIFYDFEKSEESSL